MSQKKKPVTVADLAKTASTKGAKKRGRQAPARATASTAAEAMAAKAAYQFVSEKRPRAKARAKAEDNRPRPNVLCRVPVVRTLREAAELAREAIATARRLGTEVRDRLLAALTERYA